MLEAMSDLEKYMNAEDTQDVLIRAGLIHYQFETIHPFLDGNGRIGRLLITLFFLQRGVLHKPSLYISYFLKRNRTEYYDRLSEVRDKGNYEQWIRFFLQALIESAQDAVLTIDQLSALHLQCTTEIAKMGRSAKSALRLFAYLEANPIIDVRKTAKVLNVSFNTVANAVDHLTQVGILKQAGTESRNRTYAFAAYLDILRKGT
jgi:Fic family protein